MSVGVFTRNKRFTLVQGQVTATPDPGFVACGPGEEFSMEVTGASIRAIFDTIAEVFYRVRDAKFGGTAYTDYGFAVMNLSVKGADPPVNNYSGTTSDLVIERAYANTDIPPVNSESEYDIWRGPLKTPVNNHAAFPGGSTSRGPIAHGIVTGLTQYAESYEVSSGYYPYGHDTGNTTEWAAAIELGFTGYVAWVDVSGDGDILNPTNRFFIGVQFQSFSEDYKLLTGGYSPFPSPLLLVDAYSVREYSGNEGPSGSLSVILETATLEIPLYSSVALFTTVGAALTLTATEWWPYNRLAEPRSIWDAVTGEFVPIDAPFAAFDQDNLDLIPVFF